jgi:hypothetical protein
MERSTTSSLEATALQMASPVHTGVLTRPFLSPSTGAARSSIADASSIELGVVDTAS